MKKWRYLLIASILIFTLACGLVDVAKNLTGGDDEPEATVEVEAVAAADEDDDAEHEADVEDDDDSESHVEDEDEPADVEDDEGDAESADDDVPSVDADALDMFDSYRISIKWEVNYDDGTSEVMDMEVAATRDPLAFQYLMDMDGEGMEMIQIDNSMWIRFGDEWMASTAEEMDMEDFGDFMITDADMDMDSWDKDDYTYLGKETVNGIKTKHYQAEYNETWAAIFAQEEVDDVEDVVADFWIANEKDLPAFTVKMQMTITGTLDEQNGEMTIEQEIYDVNEPITIEAPEGVTAGLPEDVPTYPNATDFASFGGMATFNTDDPVTDVADFYIEELEAFGWTQGEYTDMGTMVMATYSKDGQSMTLSISEDDSGTVVLIMIE